MNNPKARIAIIVAILVVVALIVLYGLFGRNKTSDVTDTPPAQPATSSAAPSPTPTVIIPEGCPADPHPIANPVKMYLVNHDNREMPMLSLGMDISNTAPEAPPGTESHTVGWWNEGPAIGSNHGKAVLTSHTFQWGGALGNELNDGLLQVGDIIKFVGDNGDSACYRYTGAAHILVKDYQPDSNILYDDSGDPMVALVVCSDYTPSGDAEGRMIHYGELIHA